MTTRTDYLYEAADGQELACTRWAPETAPKAVVQIAHGMAEHKERYARVAAALNDAGYVVHADDHRGHGRTAAEHGTYGVARPGGWDAMVDDLVGLGARIRAEHDGLPHVLFGHSMGSFLAQAVLQRDPSGLAGVVLSGSSGGLELDDEMLAGLTALGHGDVADQPSEPLVMMFAGFNEPFGGPDATGFEWLSRDADEVAAYVADPWCGEPMTNGFAADMLIANTAMWEPENEANIPGDLPVYVMSGRDDPVGGEDAETVEALVARYRAHGVPVTANLYPGARHELLNETNRDEVTADLIAWLDATIA